MCIRKLRKVLPATCLGLASWLFPFVMPAFAMAELTETADTHLEQRVLEFLDRETRHLGNEVTITLHSSAVKMPLCESPEPFLTNPEQKRYGRVSVGVRCGEQVRTTRYLQADVSVLTEHVVTIRDVMTGTALTADDLTLREARLERLPRHALLSIDEAVGLLASRPLSAGATLQHHHLRQEPLVERGQRVTVIAQGSGFKVSREATALDSGGLGDVIRLRTEGRQRLEAQVVGRGKLHIAF